MFKDLIPYSDIHELNLDWIIKKVREYVEKTDKMEINFDDLKTYVMNYFDNLDVQNEINIKLEEMYENGELSDIIQEYLQVSSLLTYNTINDLKNATNLIDGVDALVDGENTYNDGLTNLYKIRTLTSSDIIDEINILSLTNYPTLIAELILQFESRTNYNQDDKKIIMIGDSYGIQQFSNSPITTFFWQYFMNALHLTENETFFKSFQSGAGFGNGEFLTQLQNISSLIDDNDSITDIIVVGGWNDSDTSQSYGTDEAFNSGVNNFDSYVRATYPNATISLGHISWGDPQIKPEVHEQMRVSIRRYQEQSGKGWRILNGCEYILHRYGNEMWQEDGAHPKQFGQSLLGLYLPSCFINGTINIYAKMYQRTLVGISPYVINGTKLNALTEEIIGDKVIISLNSNDIYIDMNDASITGNGSIPYDISGSDFVYAKGQEKNTSITIPTYAYNRYDGKYYNVMLNISLYNNLFRFRPYIQAAGFETMNLKYLWIPPFTMTISLLNC